MYNWTLVPVFIWFWSGGHNLSWIISESLMSMAASVVSELTVLLASQKKFLSYLMRQ